jgi:predicted MFS family arabinose efflux permease
VVALARQAGTAIDSRPGVVGRKASTFAKRSDATYGARVAANGEIMAASDAGETAAIAPARATGASRWFFLALIFVARTALGFQFQTLGSVAPDLTKEFAFSYAEIGMLIGLFMMPGMFLAIPAGWLGSVCSDRVLITIGLLALAAGGALSAQAHGFGLLAAGRLLCGAGFVVGTLYFTKMTADWFSGRELATAMSIMVMSWPFGIAMGQIWHGWLATQDAWRLAFWSASLFCALAAVLVFALYRPPAEAALGSSSLAGSVRLLKREWILLLIASLVWAAFNAAYVVYLSFGPRVLVAGGYSELSAAATISLTNWVALGSGVLCGQIADRTKRFDLVLYVCLAVGILALFALQATAYATASSLIVGLFGVAPAGIIMALTGEAVARERRAFGLGVFSSAYYLTVTPAPAIAGRLFDTTHWAFAAILFAIALMVLGGLANFAFRLAQRW